MLKARMGWAFWETEIKVLGSKTPAFEKMIFE
jgi:hypothetical protein